MKEAPGLVLTRVWMALSGVAGLSFFLIANLTHLFIGLNQITALIQISLNALVFCAWRQGYRVETGLKKLIAGIGTVVPIGMASITIVRIFILPYIR